MQAAARTVVRTIYEAHAGRRRDPRYDEHRQEGVFRALARMYLGSADDDAPEPPGAA